MELLPVVVLLALATGSCTAISRYLDVNIDNVKKMVLEYDPVVRNQEHPKNKGDHVPLNNLAVRQFHENIKKAEAVNAEPIPAVASQLGLTDLVDKVKTADLVKTLESPGPFTVFGPTNDAFKSLPAWAREATSNKTILAEVLKFHVLSGKVESKSLSNELLVSTVEGSKLRINTYTVEGKTVATAQCAKIDLTRVDQEASNGVIHVINSVMIPPGGNIVATLAACPVFKTLVTAVKVSKLVDTLSGPGPFTVFAPTDKAFGKLPPGTLDKLIKNPTELAKILTYHVVPGTFCSSGLSSGAVKTVEGQDLMVKVSADGVVVNESKVISADGSVTNGVVHAIDTVLLPPNFTMP